MTPDASAPRPRQVTLAAALVIAGSLLLLASVFERLATLRSLDSRTSIQQFLSRPPGSDLGISLESVLDLLRVVAMLGGALAAAAAILGYHVLKRNRGARVGLAVLAVPLFLTGATSGGFLATFVAVSIAMLWLPPAREWFTGRSGSPARPERSRASAPATTPGPPQSVSSSPPPWNGYGRATPYAAPPPAHPVQPPQPARPRAVLVACVITWACCALAAMFGLLLVMVMTVDADGLFTELHRQNPQLTQDVSDGMLEATAWVSGIVAVRWSVVSAGLAVLVFRRVRWAAYGLVASAGLVALMCLVGSVASPVLVLPGVLAAAAAVLLLQGPAHRWLSGREESWRPSA
ncbi:MAG: hypothetical protein ABIO16_02250 [Nocardioides sp.]